MKTRHSVVALLVLNPVVLFIAGCFLRGAADEPAGTAIEAVKKAEASREDEPRVKNEIVRQLLKKLDDTDADPESVRTVRKILIQADEELSQALAGNGRTPRRQAVSSPSKTPTGPAEPVLPANQAEPSQAGGHAQEAVPPNASEPDKAKTRIVEALLTVLDDIADIDKDAEDVIRDALSQADSQLSQILGGKSKERILRANRKPPVRVPVEPHHSSPGKTGKANQDSDAENQSPPHRDGDPSQ